MAVAVAVVDAFTTGPHCCPPLSERPLTAEEAERTAVMFKGLGDPVRLRLFSLVASHEGGEACVCDISGVGVSQPTVSHHLKELREAGLLSSERRGTWVYYKVEGHQRQAHHGADELHGDEAGHRSRGRCPRMCP
ncbi:ArsR/SmtB family transcription factor [Streptomyces goshikiensis]|uniref:ArsR/SmtB family transcription factor n=1 Tax=Streptomyces goshikiensis TaxID=1942 RepID=UPI003683C1C5